MAQLMPVYEAVRIRKEGLSVQVVFLVWHRILGFSDPPAGGEIGQDGFCVYIRMTVAGNTGIEVSSVDIIGLNYPLYEFTSSGITHTWSQRWPEENQHRVSGLVIKKSFGLISIVEFKIDWNGSGPSILLEMRGHNDAVFDSYTLKF